MPVRFRLTLEPAGGVRRWPSRYVCAYSLRGALVPLLRDVAGVDEVHGRRYSIYVHDPASRLVADFSLLSDALAAPAHRALAHLGRSAE